MVCVFTLLRNNPLTGFAEIQADFWDGFEGGFMRHLNQVDKDLAAAGLPSLVKASAAGRHGFSMVP